MSLWLTSHLLLWLAVAVLALVVFAITRQIGVLYERVAPGGALMLNRRLRVGAPAPVVEVTDLDGARVTVGARNADGSSRLLFFLSPDCPVCKHLLLPIQSIAAKEQAWLKVLLASDGAHEDHAGFVQRYHLQRFSYVVSAELGMAYGVARLPYAVLLDADGNVLAFGLVNSREHLESLFEAAERQVASLQDYLQQRREAQDGG